MKYAPIVRLSFTSKRTHTHAHRGMFIQIKSVTVRYSSVLYDFVREKFKSTKITGGKQTYQATNISAKVSIHVKKANTIQYIIHFTWNSAHKGVYSFERNDIIKWIFKMTNAGTMWDVKKWIHGCIPVGCLPTAFWPYPIAVSLSGGGVCLPGGGGSVCENITFPQLRCGR